MMILQLCCTILQNENVNQDQVKKAPMDSTNHQPTAHEPDSMQASRDELAQRISRAIREDGTVEPLEGLRLRRASRPMDLGHGVSDPAFCVIAQGSKEIRLGERRYQYDPAHYLV